MRGMVFCALLAVAAPSVAIAQDAPAAAAIDPARQAAADRAVAALVPDGIYARMMRDQFPAMMDAMTAQMMGMRSEDFGQPADGRTMAETMREADPAYEERMKITTRVMSQEMGTVMGKMEPRVRAGLGRAFARKFTVQQLGDMNAFFATPSGKAFADEYLALFADPEMMTEMTAMAPEMMKAMPDMMKKVEAATAHLPPVKKPAEDAAE